ncbi:hypothetical protein Ancab_017199 [Ancistrocladus abbreviatus]
MTAALRLLSAVASSPTSAEAEQPNTGSAKSDYAVILAALTCALICAVGLALVARCACLHRQLRLSVTPISSPSSPIPPAPRGLRKNSLLMLPTVTYTSGVVSKGKISECAICLSEFSDGDLMRLLPRCGHVFHVSCIDTWLGQHSSCPSCRELVLEIARCDRCGGIPVAEIDNREIGMNTREDQANGFLP